MDLTPNPSPQTPTTQPTYAPTVYKKRPINVTALACAGILLVVVIVGVYLWYRFSPSAKREVKVQKQKRASVVQMKKEKRSSMVQMKKDEKRQAIEMKKAKRASVIEAKRANRASKETPQVEQHAMQAQPITFGGVSGNLASTGIPGTSRFL